MSRLADLLILFVVPIFVGLFSAPLDLAADDEPTVGEVSQVDGDADAERIAPTAEHDDRA